jgi:hypothetical protein
MLDLLVAVARPVVPRSSDRIDRGIARVKEYSRVEEIQVEHYKKGIEKDIENSTWLAFTPDDR